MVNTRELLKAHKLRDTQSRRLVIEALIQHSTPMQPKDVLQRITDRGAAVNLVTIYRTLELFENLGLIHSHQDGTYSSCSFHNQAGHHGFLRCSKCNTIEEFVDKKLCSIEDDIAKLHGFTPKQHFCEITGLCPACS